MIGLIILVLILLIFYLNQTKEKFEQIWWNASPSTRNMSYDLRCEPKIPKRDFYFRGSSIQPLIRPKCLNSI